jgi:drug/metabolite transporter (DMT)-like permease
MTSQSANLRGIIFMVLSTGFFACNDAFMKLATVGLPPVEVLFLRGVMASIIALPVVLLTGNGPKLGHVFNRWVLLRNFCELLSVLCFVVALASMAIADLTALVQLAPMIVILGAGLLYRDKIGIARAVLIALGFVGALLVAQPSSNGISVFTLLGLGCAVGTACRDLLARKVGPQIPTLVVAYGVLLVVMVGAGLTSMVFEHWVAPDTQHLVYLACAGFLLSIGQFFVFLSYRTGATAAVAPFFYSFVIFAVGTGFFVFQTLPNLMAFAGIALIIVSGVAVMLVDIVRREPVPVETPIG